MRRVDMTLPQLAEHIRFQTAASKMAVAVAQAGDLRKQAKRKELPAHQRKRAADHRHRGRARRGRDSVRHRDRDHPQGRNPLHALHVAVLRSRRPRNAGASWCRCRRTIRPRCGRRLVARINGLFGGKLAPESFVLSQAYLYGSVNNNPDHRVEVIDGDFLDLRDDIYAGSIFKDGSRVGDQGCRSRLQWRRSAAPGLARRRRSGAGRPRQDRGRARCRQQRLLVQGLAERCRRRFTTNSANTASSCSTAGRQRPQARLSKTGSHSRGIRRQKPGTLARCAHACTSITIATIFHYADQADPDWRHRYDDEERQRAFARMAAGAGASNGAGAQAQVPGPAAQELAAEPVQAQAAACATAVADIRHALCVDGSGQHTPEGLALRAPSDPEIRNRNSCPRRPRQVVADHGGDAAQVSGKDLLGVTPKERLRVWLWNLEDPQEETQRKIQAAR